ncbi:unnamed protein product [Amoebophrya sp. A25]|nr:unnamed protein product [Amoebophrya sp. A25]|eukprot:GSA25T00001192001.1
MKLLLPTSEVRRATVRFETKTNVTASAAGLGLLCGRRCIDREQRQKMFLSGSVRSQSSASARQFVEDPEVEHRRGINIDWNNYESGAPEATHEYHGSQRTSRTCVEANNVPRVAVCGSLPDVLLALASVWERGYCAVPIDTSILSAEDVAHRLALSRVQKVFSNSEKVAALAHRTALPHEDLTRAAGLGLDPGTSLSARLQRILRHGNTGERTTSDALSRIHLYGAGCAKPCPLTFANLRERIRIAQSIWQFRPEDAVRCVDTEVVIDGGIVPLLAGARILPSGIPLFLQSTNRAASSSSGSVLFTSLGSAGVRSALDSLLGVTGESQYVPSPGGGLLTGEEQVRTIAVHELERVSQCSSPATALRRARYRAPFHRYFAVPEVGTLCTGNLQRLVRRTRKAAAATEGSSIFDDRSTCEEKRVEAQVDDAEADHDRAADAGDLGRERKPERLLLRNPGYLSCEVVAKGCFRIGGPTIISQYFGKEPFSPYVQRPNGKAFLDEENLLQEAGNGEQYQQRSSFLLRLPQPPTRASKNSHRPGVPGPKVAPALGVRRHDQAEWNIKKVKLQRFRLKRAKKGRYVYPTDKHTCVARTVYRSRYRSKSQKIGPKYS